MYTRSKYCLTNFFLTATIGLILLPRRIHLASLRRQSNEAQDIESETNNFTKDTLSDVELFKEDIPEDSPKTVSITQEKLETEPGFDLTADEMDKFKIWPYGIIPYYIDDYSFDPELMKRLRTLLNAVNLVTGLRFMELTRPSDESDRWVLFINRRGQLNCEDYTTNSFTNTGVQRVVLGYDCLSLGGGALAPMVLALAGVPPQHNAPNRDQYINVILDNVIPDKQHLFNILRDDEWLFHDIPYDFLSAGHYDSHKYTVNGSATIVPKQEVIGLVGEGEGISYSDILKIKMLYNYIKRKSPKAKASDCSQLYKPGNNFNQFQPLNEDLDLLPRVKPLKYSNVPTKRGKNKHRMLKNKAKKADKLADLPDIDTDEG